MVFSTTYTEEILLLFIIAPQAWNVFGFLVKQRP